MALLLFLTQHFSLSLFANFPDEPGCHSHKNGSRSAGDMMLFVQRFYVLTRMMNLTRY